MGDTYVKSDENENILHIDAIILYGHSMSQPLPYNEITFDRNVKLPDIIKISDDSDIVYSAEVNLKHPDRKKYERKDFPIGPLKEIIPQDKFT